MSIFAAVWWVVGIRFSGYGSILLYTAGIVITLAIAAAAWRANRRMPPQSADEDTRRGKLIGIASGIEGVAILVVINILVPMHRPDLIGSAIAVIVGLHFIPLAISLPARPYFNTAALLIALGFASAAIPDVKARALVIGIGAAAVLWVTSGFALMPRRASQSGRAS